MVFTISIFFFIILIMSAIIHEYSHGWMAHQLGDPTAKDLGRLTLNPIPHIDLIGTIVVPLFLVLSGTGFIFGWAKPVPYNPFRLSDKRWGPAMVAFAGPAANLIIALLIAIVIRSIGVITPFTTMLTLIVYVNVLLAVFNLIPIPPLDGSKILFALLPNSEVWFRFKVIMERYGMIFVFIFAFMAWGLIAPVIFTLIRLLIGPQFLGVIF